MLRSRTIREGSVGLFALLGLIIFSGITIWLRGGGFGQEGYEITVEFPDVGGLQVGAPVRYRGVTVGKIRAFKPGSNIVETEIEISSSDIQIPKDVTIETNRYGLIGEASVDITPLASLPPEAEKIDPLSKNCQSEKLIICNEDLLQGQAGGQLLASMNRLAQAYSDPAFVSDLNSATKNASLAAAKIAKLSDDFSLVLRASQRDLAILTRNLSGTSQSVTQTADRTSRLLDNLDTAIGENRPKLTRTVDETAQLVENLNNLLIENRSRLAVTLENINQTSEQLNALASNLNTTATKFSSTLDDSDTRMLVQNLEAIVANAAETSANLRALAQKLNDPTILLTVQQTLESARVTFENTQKITSDLDELTGDPEFRSNLRKLVNGLGDLVSSAEQLEYHIQVAQALESVNQELSKPQILQPLPSASPTQSADEPEEKLALPTNWERERRGEGVRRK